MQLTTNPVSQEELMAYLDGELPMERASSVAAHLERCRDCQALAADLQSVSRHMLEWQIELENPQAIRRVTEALASEPIPRPRMSKTSLRFVPTSRWAWAISMAAVLVLIGLITARRPMREKTVTVADSYIAAKRFTPQESITLDGAPQKDVLLHERRAVEEVTAAPTQNSGPMIVRTAELTVSTGDFERTRSDVERILAENRGYIAHLTVTSPQNEGRILDATLRLPASRLDALLSGLKKLGHVQAEAQGAEEVTQQYVDIDARLSNLRVTEQRLTDILRQRTGKLADVLAVEEQVDNVRGEIERVEAEQKSLSKQIALATVSLKLVEEYKAPLRVEDSSTSTRLRNAAVDGYRTVVDVGIGVLLFLLSAGPILVIIGLVLLFPGRMLWRKMLKRRATRA